MTNAYFIATICCIVHCINNHMTVKAHWAFCEELCPVVTK